MIVNTLIGLRYKHPLDKTSPSRYKRFQVHKPNITLKGKGIYSEKVNFSRASVVGMIQEVLMMVQSRP